MAEINMADVIQITLGVMAEFSDSGDMVRNGVEFIDMADEIVISYNTFTVPHIIYQEEGFIHYLTGEIVDPNKGFISEKTTGQLAMYGFSQQLGIPYNMLEVNQILLENQNKMLEELGGTQRV